MSHLAPLTHFDDSGQRVAIIEPTFDERLDAELEAIIERRVDERVASQVWEAISRLCAEILKHRNPQVTVVSISFAAGLYVLEGKSMTQLARELGVTRAAISAALVTLTNRTPIIIEPWNNGDCGSWGLAQTNAYGNNIGYGVAG